MQYTKYNKNIYIYFILASQSETYKICAYKNNKKNFGAMAKRRAVPPTRSHTTIKWYES